MHIFLSNNVSQLEQFESPSLDYFNAVFVCIWWDDEGMWEGEQNNGLAAVLPQVLCETALGKCFFPNTFYMSQLLIIGQLQ